MNLGSTVTLQYVLQQILLFFVFSGKESFCTFSLLTILDSDIACMVHSCFYSG